jgi:hypothetical protein|tara:strand:+ start:460 stop:750 length:291 start_codon:yes stop_codon:yes gene_type:complete
LKGNPSAPYRYRDTKPLVRKYLAQTRKLAKDAQSYGGSTGGRKSLDSQGRGMVTLSARSAEAAERGKVFAESGRGALGARQSVWEVKKDLYPDLGT